jgi:hypothetical protein
MPLAAARNPPPTTGSPTVSTAPSPDVLGRLPVSTVVTRAPTISRSTAAGPPPSQVDTVPTAPTVARTDLDQLARQLFEPVSRLLRADLRQGRERAGRGHDRRR